MEALGQHLLVELYDCNPSRINDAGAVEEALVEAVERSGAQIVQPFFHQFSPHGISGVVVIAESHFTIHTWPEYGYCAVDIFTCGDRIRSEEAVQHLRRALEAGSISVMETKRGILSLTGEALSHKPVTVG